MKKILFILSFVFFLTIQLSAQESFQREVEALNGTTNELNENEKLSLFSDVYMGYKVNTFPEYGIYIGKRTENEKWTDMSLSAIEQRKRDISIFLNTINSIKRAGLDSKNQLDYDLLKNEIELTKQQGVFPEELLPINQMSGYHQVLVNVAEITPLASKKDVDIYLSRLQNIPILIDQVIVLMDEGIKKGIVSPKITLTGVPEQIQNIINKESAESPLLKNLYEYLDKLPVEQKTVVSETATKILSEKVNPSLNKLKLYLEHTYIPKSRESIGLKSLPNGESWYNYNIKHHTTTTLSYQQIHEIGLREVQRIRLSMDSLIKTTDFKGTFNEFLNYLRTDPKFFYKSPEELLNGYRTIAKRIDAELPKLFGKLPRLPYGISPIPEYDEKFQTTAYYKSGSSQNGRPGVFYANTYDLKSRPKWEMEALTIHEAVPGHHLQISLAEELENVPEFRKYTSYTSFVEGWGLYSESLGEEMGFYTDPYSKFGQLTYEMWRAVRLVVDTGIHGLGWSRQQAIDYFSTNTSKTSHDIEVEVDRYIAWPGQALAYKIGELKIKELKTKAQKELKDKFDIRKFHDTILSNGAIPLNILEEKVNEWIKVVKQQI